MHISVTEDSFSPHLVRQKEVESFDRMGHLEVPENLIIVDLPQTLGHILKKKCLKYSLKTT